MLPAQSGLLLLLLLPLLLLLLRHAEDLLFPLASHLRRLTARLCERMTRSREGDSLSRSVLRLGLHMPSQPPVARLDMHYVRATATCHAG
jgi:hypothetical protein